MISTKFRISSQSSRLFFRAVSTLKNNSHIKVFDNAAAPSSYILTYLDTNPPFKNTCRWRNYSSPPNTSVIQRKPQVYINTQRGGIRGHRGSSGKQGGGGGAGGGGAGGASAQGGAGGAGRGGFVHLSDRRNPPDFGRIAWPEDILGSVEVDEAGEVVGKLQPSGTYRAVTKEGILGLSPFLRGKLIDRLRQEEAKEKKS
ncbi:uncharacterized protein TrAtP1_004751 [Trichoderma atroviride]|uniref:uncharacterized protein n=1 Tax=Hypocrea atroviridis TaxID=63577 RepID=UPI0033263C4C|nr:hypothetical protein TrAtP1_004751 [Trichoderma atroviride]